MKQILVLVLLSLSTSLFATHTYGGYISYEHQSGTTYQISVHLFQDINSPAIQRQEIEINYGDNTGADTIFKTSEVFLNNSPFNIREMVYTTQHTYNGSGSYTVSVEDPNRPANIINLANSLTTPIFIKTDIQISPLDVIQNNSPTINSNPVVYSKVGKEFKFNLSAFDKDGDFLTYKLVRPRGSAGFPINSYSFPSGTSIDKINGEFNWENPPTQTGFHQFSVEITECRNDAFIATTNLDFMVYNSTSNFTSGFTDTLNFNKDESGNISYIITPGDSLEFDIGYQSTDTFKIRMIDGLNRATFDSTGNFKFVSQPEDNRCAPYIFVFEADTRGVLDHETVMIRVIDTNLINCDTLCGFNVLSVHDEYLSNEDDLKVYPNPFTNKTIIELPSNFQLADFSILNRLGQEVKVKKTVTNQQIKITRFNLPDGIYIYRVIGLNNRVLSGKLVAQ